MTACPRCGVDDRDAPCTGDPSHGSKPLPYRHAGREPAGAQLRLDEPRRFPVPPCPGCKLLGKPCWETVEGEGGTVACEACGERGSAATWTWRAGGARKVEEARKAAGLEPTPGW